MYTKGFLKGFLLASAMVFGVILFSGTDAIGQYRDRNNDRDYRNDDRYNNRQDDDDRYNGRDRRGNQSFRFAFQRGYNDGLRQGRMEARGNNRRSNRGNNRSYRNNRGYGNNSRYQQSYQQGFQRGYQDGLNRTRTRNRRSILSNLGF